MKHIDPATIKKAQAIMLEMLIEFDSICKKYNLIYWLDSGTLLGAVRHKGFIPWDDDIDLSMPIEDYNKFLDIAQNELSDNIFFQTRQTDKEFKFDYIKLRSNKAKIVEFHEEGQEIKYHQGVFVDIFPMLNIENNSSNKELYENTLNEIRLASSISLHTPNGNDNPTRREEMIEVLDSLHKGWDDNSCKVIYSGKMPDVAAWFCTNKVLPVKELEFEGIKFPVPNNYHNYLSEIYSFNYMELPPIESRKIHAAQIIVN